MGRRGQLTELTTIGNIAGRIFRQQIAVQKTVGVGDTTKCNAGLGRPLSPPRARRRGRADATSETVG